LNRFKNLCIESLAPFVGLAGTTFGIFRAFNYLDSRSPTMPSFPGF
jgi:biopolymer transport protein ExbB/TolQ